MFFRILSGCYDSTIHIWDINGEHKLTIPGHTAPVKSVAWLKCGKVALNNSVQLMLCFLLFTESKLIFNAIPDLVTLLSV